MPSRARLNRMPYQMPTKPSLPALQTPAFVYSELALARQVQHVAEFCNGLDVQLLFPLKCHNIYSALQIIANHVDGFAVSSLFEARLAREILADGKKIHFTSPGLRADELQQIVTLCDTISF